MRAVLGKTSYIVLPGEVAVEVEIVFLAAETPKYGAVSVRDLVNRVRPPAGYKVISVRELLYCV